MNHRPLILALLVAFAGLLVGCPQLDTGAVARMSAARLLHCGEGSVEMTQIGAYRYRGEGCDGSVVVTCTSASLEPRCLPARDILTSGAEAATDEEDEDDDEDEDDAEDDAGDDAPDPEIEALIRAGLEARRGDVLACTGQDRVGIRAAYAPDGSIDLSVQGALAGTPEERCVQDALDGVRVPAHGTAGVVIHLVH